MLRENLTMLRETFLTVDVFGKGKACMCRSRYTALRSSSLWTAIRECGALACFKF